MGGVKETVEKETIRVHHQSNQKRCLKIILK